MIHQFEIQTKERKILHSFLCIALGGNTFLHPYIEDCYRKNEREYYEAFQKSELKNNPLFSMYSTKSEEKIRQVAGLMEWCYQHHQFAQLDHLIKKGYKFVYRYWQRNFQIDFEHFMRSYAKKKNNSVKELELIYQNIVLWYLCIRENKPFNRDDVAWQSFQEVLNTSIEEIDMQKSMFSKEMCEKQQKEIDALYEEFNIPKNQRLDSLGFLLEHLINNGFNRINDINPNCDTRKAEEQVFQESPVKYIGALGGWLKALKIHELDATEQTPLTKKDLDHIFLELLYAGKYNHIKKEEQAFLFITCLYMKCLSSLYQETKHLYLDQSKQDFYIEMKSKEAQLQEQESDLLHRQREWQLLNQKQQKEMEGLSQELREAHAKIRRLELQIMSMEDYAEEVHALRNYVYWEVENDHPFDKTPSMVSMQQYIQSKRIVIFGGYPIWQQRLKEFHPSIEFVDVSEVNRDISKIQRADAVFIQTKVFSHAFYKKIIKELSKTETPLYYLNGQSNIEKTTEEIYKWLIE